MGSRPSGFDRYWDGNIHFESIPQRKRKEFLFSRLQSLKKDIPKSSFDIESKLQEIEIFLTGNILDEDLKNTPLILYFLCEISVGDENSKGLPAIYAMRADLYEEIILEFSQNISEMPKQRIQNSMIQMINSCLRHLDIVLTRNISTLDNHSGLKMWSYT